MKKIKVLGKNERINPISFRAADGEGDGEESRTIEISFSSEEPVERWFYTEEDGFHRGLEILDHSKKSAHLDRLKSFGSLHLHHNWTQPVAPLDDVRIENKTGRASATFGRGELAEKARQDVKDRVIRGISVGYDILEYTRQKKRSESGLPIYRAVWEALEASLVTVPADTRVGVGRSKPTDAAEKELRGITLTREETEMDPCEVCGKQRSECSCKPATSAVPVGAGTRGAEPTPPPAPSTPAPAAPVRAEAVDPDKVRTEERQRAQEIRAYGEQFQLTELAERAVREGTDLEQFRLDALSELGNRSGSPISPVNDANPNIGMSARDLSRYSLLRMLRARYFPEESSFHKESAFERECSDAVAKKLGRQPEGFYIPFDVLESPHEGTRNAIRHTAGRRGAQLRDFQVGDPGSGGYLVATDLLPGSFIEILRASSVVARRTQFIPGLTGNLAIPKQTNIFQFSWTGEASGGTETDASNFFGLVTMQPRHCRGHGDLTREIIMQSSIAMEGFLRAEIALAWAVELDRVILNGDGVAEPLGVLNTTGIGSTVFSDAAPTWAKVVNLETQVNQDNALFGSIAYITNPQVFGQTKTISKVANTARFLYENGDMNGYPVDVTTTVPSTLGAGSNRSALLFGNWGTILVGFWSALDIKPNPYILSPTGGLRLEMFQDIDMVLRHEEALAAGVDIDHAA